MRVMARFVPPVTSHTHRALVKCPFLILIIINCHEHHDQKSHLVLFRDFALGAGEDSDHSSVTIPEDGNDDDDNHGDHGDDDDYHYECDYDDPDDQKRKDCIPVSYTHLTLPTKA